MEQSYKSPAAKPYKQKVSRKAKIDDKIKIDQSLHS